MRNGWVVKTWEDALEVRSGRNQKTVLDPNGKYPILGSAGSVMGYANDYICEEGTTIIGRKGSIDTPLFIESKFWNVDTAFGLIAGPELDKRYLYYFCLSIDFKKLDKGTTLPSLVKKDLIKLQIPIPPLPEQKQIVAILDQAFTAIDQAKANIQQNIDNAKELFQSKLNEVFSQKGDGWEEKRLGEISTRIGDGLHGTPDYDDNGDYFFINGNNLEDGRIIIKENTKRVNQRQYDLHKRELGPNTVLVSINGTLGKVGFYENEPVILGKSACYINLIDGVNKNFIRYLIQSPTFFQHMLNESTGATIKNFSLKSMRNYPLFLPSSEKQRELVESIESINQSVQYLLQTFQAKLSSLDELKKSILQRAFSGALSTSSVPGLEDEQDLSIAAEPKAEYGGK